MKFIAAFIVAISVVAPAFADDDTSQCLSDCTKKFVECTQGGPATKACLEARTKCVNSCGK